MWQDGIALRTRLQSRYKIKHDNYNSSRNQVQSEGPTKTLHYTKPEIAATPGQLLLVQLRQTRHGAVWDRSRA
jgi:hypothetical protein